jgi:hypothetical protein
LKTGALALTHNLFYKLTMKNIEKNLRSHDLFMLSDITLTQWWRLGASSEALDLFHWAMCAVMYRRITMTIKMASKLGVFVHCCLFACCPGGR